MRPPEVKGPAEHLQVELKAAAGARQPAALARAAPKHFAGMRINNAVRVMSARQPIHFATRRRGSAWPAAQLVVAAVPPPTAAPAAAAASTVCASTQASLAVSAMVNVKLVTAPLADKWAKAVAARAVNLDSNAIWDRVAPVAAMVSRVARTAGGRHATTGACAWVEEARPAERMPLAIQPVALLVSRVARAGVAPAQVRSCVSN